MLILRVVIVEDAVLQEATSVFQHHLALMLLFHNLMEVFMVVDLCSGVVLQAN